MEEAKQGNERLLKTMDEESVILERFRMISSFRIKFLGRFFHCLSVERLIKSPLFSKSWVDSSSKSDPPPDFHNDKHHTMMEFMRIDDSTEEIDGRKVNNSFAHERLYMKKHAGYDYKKKLSTCELFFLSDTSNDAEFNFKGYVKNFERVLLNHSEKADSYHLNYPKCKTLVLFVCDESNAYYEASRDTKRLHLCFYDKKFIEIIKECKADYVVWFTLYKSVSKGNGKEMKLPLACIYDVKHIKEKGYDYDHNIMVKRK